MNDPLQRIADLVQRHSGIALGPGRRPALLAAIERVCAGAGPSQLLELAAGGVTLDRLVDELTVNETFFMRHRAELDAIPWTSLLGAARRAGRPGVRVWSAACSTGEEAYSLAILALQALPGETMPVSVLATDISRSCLARAAQGRYGARALRHVEPELRRRYLDPGDDGTAAVNGELRGCVRVARHNLVGDCFPPAGEEPFDVIVCRNVLIYFDAATAARTASHLRGALGEAGVLVLGASDRLTVPACDLGRRGAPPAPPLRNAPRRPSARASAPGRAATPARSARQASDQRAPLALALADADAGRLAAALSAIEPILDADPLNTVALCIQGLVQHAAGDPSAALQSLRRAVYLDPGFARAAFELGRAQDALGDGAAARRAYRQALEGLQAGAPGDPIMGAADHGLADACRVRLAPPAAEARR